ncbi:MAG: SH3 domain-containing protein [Polyangiaceae bacterium]
MRAFRRALLLIGFLAEACDGVPRPKPSPGPPSPPSTGVSASLRRVRLVAHSGEGVPLHPARGSSEVSGRVPGGIEVEVVSESPDGRWLEIRTQDGRRGFITARYVAGAKDAADAPLRPAPSPSAWDSLAGCEAAVRAGERLAKAQHTARIASYNVRWFPDGKPGKGRDGEGTDVAWLACGIAWLDAEAVAVQEFKTNERGRAALAELTRKLDQLTGGRWASSFDDCPSPDVQHVGILFDEKRVKHDQPTTVAQLNPHGEACKNSLRPGHGAYLTFPGGLDLFLISVHSKSGSDARSYDLRQKTLAAFSSLGKALKRPDGDSDIVVAGDFNTMGCDRCTPALSADDELERTDRALGPSFRRVVAAQDSCSEYHAGRPASLDHFVVTTALRELTPGRAPMVSGYCAALHCSVGPDEPPPAARALSDHCPLVLDFEDRDLD